MAWFLCPYRRRIDLEAVNSAPERYCAMNDFTALIAADGGRWAEAECLGNHAVVKVTGASLATLASIAAESGFTRLPKDALDLSLADLSAAQRNAITSKLEALGYTQAEWRAALGNNIGQRTLRDVLRFALTRRHKWTSPYFDGSGNIVLSGPVQACRPVENVDQAV
jgi:hypothetical protein